MHEIAAGFLRMCAVVAFAIGLFGAQTTVSAQESGPCQVIFGGDVDTSCEVVVDQSNDTCAIVIEDETVQEIANCSTDVLESCPYQLVANTDEGTLTVQIQCVAEGAGLTATDTPPTATDVPPTATDVPPTATDVPPTATDVPPTATGVPSTATDVPPTGTVEPTVEPTAADTDTDTESDTGKATETVTDTERDTDTDTDEVVIALPSTGSGTDNSPLGALVVIVSAVGVVLAGAAFAWQRRDIA